MPRNPQSRRDLLPGPGLGITVAVVLLFGLLMWAGLLGLPRPNLPYTAVLPGATLLALGSAALHAAWNLLIKTSDERFLAAWGQFLVGGLLFVPVLVVIGPPGTAVLPFLVASSCVHVVYVGALVRAYHHGDFSFAYPVARGGGALLAAIGGVLFLSDTLSGGEWLAILVVVAGLVSLVRPGVSSIAPTWYQT